MSLTEVPKSTRARTKKDRNHWPVFAAIGCLVIIFANSFGVLRIGLYAIFGLALILPFFNRHTTWRNSVVNLPGIFFIYFSLFATAFHSVSTYALYNGIITSLSVGVFLTFIATTPAVGSLEEFIQRMSSMARALLVLGLLMELFDVAFVWNTKTGFLFCLLVFVLIDTRVSKSQKFLFIAFWFIQSYLIDDRAYLIAGAIFGLAYWILPFLGRNPVFGKAMILTFLGSLILVPLAYVQLSMSSYRSYLDNLSLTYTGGRFFSGRDIIWRELIDTFVNGNVLIGGGHAVGSSVLYGSTLSSHNTYIAVLTRMGILGLVAFLALFYGLLKAYLKYVDLPVVRISAAATIALLFKQSTEFSLIGNNIAHSLMTWLVLALGFIYLNAARKSEPRVHIVNRQK